MKVQKRQNRNFSFSRTKKKLAKKSAIFCLRDDEKQNNRRQRQREKKGILSYSSLFIKKHPHVQKQYFSTLCFYTHTHTHTQRYLLLKMVFSVNAMMTNCWGGRFGARDDENSASSLETS